VDKLRPSAQAVAVGRALCKDPPPGYGDRYSVHGWACLVEAVWAAEAALDGAGDAPAPKAEARAVVPCLHPVGDDAETAA
jgi:hypothetical protein